MSYLGKVDMNDANIKHYSLTGSTLTTVNIGWVPASEQSLCVTINGVVQQGDTFSYSGANLTLGGPLVVTDTLEVVGIQSVGNIITPADNSVTTAKLADDAVTLAKMSGGTDGNLITYDASGNPAYVATGSATNILTSNGAGTAPTFQAAAALPDATPRWLTYVGTNQSLSSNTNTTFQYDTERYDSDSAFNTGTYTFTVPVGEAGVYFGYCSAYHQGDTNDAHQLANTQLIMGGTTFWMELDMNSSFEKTYSVGAYGLAVLAEGDGCYVKGKSIFSSGGVVIGAGAQESFFGGWRVA
jgi:hypothetical protein